jgi:hypothetical protein
MDVMTNGKTGLGVIPIIDLWLSFCHLATGPGGILDEWLPSVQQLLSCPLDLISWILCSPVPRSPARISSPSLLYR